MRCQRLFPLLALLATLVLVPQVEASIRWCKEDPVVRLGGTIVEIVVAIPEEYASKVTGPTAVEVRTAPSIQRELVMTDAGFNGYGEVVSFGDLSSDMANAGAADFLVVISVSVPIKSWKRIPLRIEVASERGETAIVEGVNLGVTLSLRISQSVYAAQTPGPTAATDNNAGALSTADPVATPAPETVSTETDETASNEPAPADSAPAAEPTFEPTAEPTTEPAAEPTVEPSPAPQEAPAEPTDGTTDEAGPDGETTADAESV